ncbi:MAG: lipoyl synthase [Planctomycetes bacterium]|nr:lipoyl synthase [Planctomycetota bacterium]MCD7895261.1 lipoyl synthase [Planctomycetaceae bacterium]
MSERSNGRKNAAANITGHGTGSATGGAGDNAPLNNMTDEAEVKREIRRLPPWLKKSIPAGSGKDAVDACLEELRLDTVCRGARCPNSLDCKSRGRAAFLLMGPFCTRSCRFCAMESGTPGPLDAEEPSRLAQAVRRLGLKHAVITSVTRDDLPDGGATHFAATVAAIRAESPETTVEILVPDFWGDEEAWAVSVDSKPDVYNHNLETVERLYDRVRPEADFDRSLALLDFAKERQPDVVTKSGLMVGLGEELEEIVDAAVALRDVGVDSITVGQYLQPRSARTLPVERFVTPEEFADLEQELRGLGFKAVACSPFVRSSYNAEEAFLTMG